MQLISFLPLIATIPNQSDPRNPHYFLHYTHRHISQQLSFPTSNVAIENDIDMMVICTCSRR